MFSNYKIIPNQLGRFDKLASQLYIDSIQCYIYKDLFLDYGYNIRAELIHEYVNLVPLKNMNQF
jgi:hypothetical protein